MTTDVFIPGNNLGAVFALSSADSFKTKKVIYSASFALEQKKQFIWIQFFLGEVLALSRSR